MSMPSTGAHNTAAAGSGPLPAVRPKLHRLATVRKQQGVSLRRVAQHLKCDVRQVRQEEDEHSDLTISRLYAWQEVLDVPVADLLTEPSPPLSRPVLERARMVRIMKTVASIMERSESQAIRRLAENLVQQLLEIMPELEGVTAWNSVGQRRSLGEFGRIAEQLYPSQVWVEP